MDQPLHENWVLMARVLAGEANTDEVRLLHNVLSEDEALSQQYELMTRLWKEEQNNPEIQFQNSDNEIQHIINLAEDNYKESLVSKPWFKTGSIRKVAIASISIAACFLLVFLGYKNFSTGSYQQPKVVQQVLKADNGTRSRNILPDGSVVWLNAGSSLVLSDEFKKGNRNVTLTGEAYFEVVKNPYPFIVHASGINIKVVGTAFNVKSYPADKTVETTLFHGIIKLSRHGDLKNEFTLKPNQKFIISRKELLAKNIEDHPLETTGIIKVIESKSENLFDEKAWIYNRLEFRGDDFETLADKLDRWYDVKIRFTDVEVKKLQFNGSFTNETIEDALKALQIANPFSYKINDHEILIGSY